MNVYEVAQDKVGAWRVKGPPAGRELSRHKTKQSAVRYAQDSAKTTISARVVIYNEDGTTDFLEHGYGNPVETPPQFLSSASGSAFPCVEESIADILSRGAQAVIHKGIPARQNAIEQVKARQKSSPQIVLVDDECFILDIQRDSLQSIGLEAERFTDPVAAWERIRLGNVSLVVTDWNMPLMSGMELLANIKTLPRPPYVIVVTALGTADRSMEATKLGAFDFLEKPFNIKDFLDIVSDALERHVRP